MGRKHQSGKRQIDSNLGEAECGNSATGELLYGLHAVRAALEQADTRVVALWLEQGRSDQSLQQITRLARERSLAPFRVRREDLDAFLPGARHQGVIARCLAPPVLAEAALFSLLDNLEEPPLLLILDGVQDPHNLGACLRTAEASGVHAVIAPKNRAVGLTSAVRKVASGAAERVPFAQVTNLARVMNELRERGIWIVGMVVDGEESLYEIVFEGPQGLGLVLGAEGRGLRRLTQEYCDYLARIPMRGGTGSLNVSVAAGVCLFEVRRQRDLNLSH